MSPQQDLSSIEEELERKLEGSLREIDLGPVPLRRSTKSNSFPIMLILVGVFVLVLFFTFFRFIGSIFGSGGKSPQTTQVPILETLPEFTNKPFLDIDGTTAPNTELQLVVNEKEESTVTADSSGDFTFKKVVLTEGENGIVVVVKNADKAAEKLESKEQVVTLDTVAPSLTYQQQEEATSETYTLTGQTDADELYVNNTLMASRNADGTFSVMLPLSEGANTFELKALDKAGNTTSKTFVITYKGNKGTGTPVNTSTPKSSVTKQASTNTPVKPVATATPKPPVDTPIPPTKTPNYYIMTPKND